jgi:hypothetical protein
MPLARPFAVAVVDCLALAGCQRPHATLQQVQGSVLLGADGRTIVADASTDNCRPPPQLLAEASLDRVTVQLSIPPLSAGNCAGVGLTLPVRVRLDRPLGSRSLVQAATGRRIAVFDEADLAAVPDLPAGFRLTGDAPAIPIGLTGTVVGDTRTYTRGRPHAPEEAAPLLTVTQAKAAGAALRAPGDTLVETVGPIDGEPATGWSAASPFGGPAVVRGIGWQHDGYLLSLVSTGGATLTAGGPQFEPALRPAALLSVAGAMAFPAPAKR